MVAVSQFGCSFCCSTALGSHLVSSSPRTPVLALQPSVHSPSLPHRFPPAHACPRFSAAIHTHGCFSAFHSIRFICTITTSWASVLYWSNLSRIFLAGLPVVLHLRIGVAPRPVHLLGPGFPEPAVTASARQAPGGQDGSSRRSRLRVRNDLL